MRFVKHIAIVILAAIIAGFFALLALYVKPLDPIKRAIQDFSFSDIYYEIKSETDSEDLSTLITIVDLTKLTNRSDIAQTLIDIESCGPKVIGLDCCFDNVGENFVANDSLIKVAETYDNIVYALKFLNYANDSIGHTLAIHSFFSDFVNITEGTVNMPRGQYDSMKRKESLAEKYNGKLYPSLISQVSDMYMDRQTKYDAVVDLAINFSPTRFTVLNPDEVKKNPGLIRDRIVLFGSMYEDSDWHWTPLGKMPGVKLIAYGIQTVIYNKDVKTIKGMLFILISFIIVLIVQLVQSYFLDRTSKAKNLFVKFIVGSPYVLGIITFFITALFVWISFIAFMMYNINFNLGWAMSVIAFFGTSRKMYAAIIDYVFALKVKRRNKQQLTNENQ
ncbi:MAG: CHASE2 domain-containing protein [Prevotellaceae bacterium]|nr:CHASE2 domain-containing protein [Prevotellaceae bacterium]